MTPVDFRRREDALRAANRSRRGGWWFSRWTRGRRGGALPPGVRRERGGLWRLLLAGGVLALVLRAFVVEAYRIPSRSMERTLLPGDFLLVNKLVYGAEVPIWRQRLPALRAPQRNDLVVFDWPVDPDVAFGKRLVGLPGDTVAMAAGVLLRNGARNGNMGLRGMTANCGMRAAQRLSPLVVPRVTTSCSATIATIHSTAVPGDSCPIRCCAAPLDRVLQLRAGFDRACPVAHPHPLATPRRRRALTFADFCAGRVDERYRASSPLIVLRIVRKSWHDAGVSVGADRPGCRRCVVQ